MTETITLGESQQAAFDRASAGDNLFVSGPGGTGKTFLVSHIVDELRGRGLRVMVTASTGIAALHCGGITIHRALGTGIAGNIWDAQPVIYRTGARMAAEVLGGVDVIIVDEVSMLTGDYLDMMDWRLRTVRKTDDPFGGVQVIFVGDFLQLPPVVKDARKVKRPFAFQAEAWESVRSVVLDKVWRQTDPGFVSVLHDIRSGDPDVFSMAVLDRHVAEWEDDGRTVLVTHRSLADSINQMRIDEIDGPPQTFAAACWSRFGDTPEKIAREFIAPYKLTLKVGARVICCKNTHSGLVNGMQGVVTGIDASAISVDFGNGAVEVVRETWETRDAQGTVLSEMKQFPLLLAWAITIHKSQGMTIDRVHVHVEKAFAHGQVYVALSRVRSLDGLSIEARIEPRLIQAHPDCVKFYNMAVGPQGDG